MFLKLQHLSLAVHGAHYCILSLVIIVVLVYDGCCPDVGSGVITCYCIVFSMDIISISIETLRARRAQHIFGYASSLVTASRYSASSISLGGGADMAQTAIQRLTCLLCEIGRAVRKWEVHAAESPASFTVPPLVEELLFFGLVLSESGNFSNLDSCD